jgi:hypothetical protein
MYTLVKGAPRRGEAGTPVEEADVLRDDDHLPHLSMINIKWVSGVVQ